MVTVIWNFLWPQEFGMCWNMSERFDSVKMLKLFESWEVEFPQYTI